VEHTGVERVEARHPNWHGFLHLRSIDNSVLFESFGSRGKYTLHDGVLTVYWDEYGPDIFFMSAGTWVHQQLLSESPDLGGISIVRVGNKTVVASRIHVIVPEGSYEVGLRLQTSDIPTFEQIFVRSGFESPDLPHSADAIVDLEQNPIILAHSRPL
jgi:hypothetical protein